MLLLYIATFAQQTTVRDSTSTTFSFNNLLLPNPDSIVSKYTYDPLTDRYIYNQSLGTININYPIILTPEEFRKLVAQETLRNYYKEKIDAYDGKKAGLEDAKKNLIPELYVDSDFFESVFGGSTIEVIPQGSVEMDLGILYTKQDNPSFSPRNRSNFTFDFDQRIELSLLGKVGTRLQVTANYDTQSSYDFQNLIKLEYTPTEDDIIQKIEVGNVSMPLNSSLITGAQSLFGVKTQLQFGKTTITGIFSEQKSQTRTVVAQGGGTLQEFEFFGLDYDENRHFFLAQYFRDNYDSALETYPYINSPIQVTRIEVWVTNRSNQTDDVRNVVALQDLGESNPANIGSAVNITAGPNAYPNNTNNAYDPTNIGGAGSQITDDIRDIATVQSGILVPGVNEGFDYGKLENARKLQEGSEFTVNTQLGYISLNQRLQNDEILAVAYQFTVGDQVYQVGEFANDGVDATDVSVDSGTGNTIVSNNSLILKMLKSTVTSVDQPIWDLMMKNIYNTGAFNLEREDFKLNIFYTESSPVNYITPVGTTLFPTPGPNEDALEETPLLRVFNLDKLNYNNDPQFNGDGFFDFVPGITVIQQNGKIIFTNVEPFGKYLFDILDIDNNPSDNEADYDDPTQYNPNQAKYVYDKLYKSTKTAALEDGEKNKFQIKGRYKAGGGGGIPIGAFNVPQGSVKVTAGGRVLVEGVDYTVNYQMGTVQILDPALQASNTPIQVSVENNAVFGQQTKRFTGINVEHQFNENFVLGATFLNLNERPITQKANYGTEPINNTIFGVNANFSTEVPFLTRLANKLPNIDTDVQSNVSLRGEFAYLLPGAPKGSDFQGEATTYVDDFEGTQNAIDLLSPISWSLSSRPKALGIGGSSEDDNGIQNGYNRALLNWYSIDPIFYSGQRPTGISDDDMSNLYTRRIFIDEIFPQQDIVQGQPTVINSLDLAYYPAERGPYNFQPGAEDGILDDPIDSWAGITRQLTSTDFEQANVEYVEFWLQDPFLDNPTNPGGKLTLNLGNISEDIIKDGRKQYENGLPENGDVSAIQPTPSWGTVVPQNQALIYAFSTLGQQRANQDVGFDGYDDVEEASVFSAFSGLEDPANDNYTYFLNTTGDVFERYKKYNGVEGNSPDTFTQTNRGSTTQPDVEDINRDNTMNTIDSYFEYEFDITPSSLANVNNTFIRDRKTTTVTLPNGDSRQVKWYQFRIPLTAYTNQIGGITDFRSIRFMRLYLSEFAENTVMRFGSLDLVRSDWRRYQQSLDDDTNNDLDGTDFNVGIIGIQENDGRYVSPPGVEREQLNNNNTLVRQNEQSLVVNVCKLEPKDSRAVFKNINVDMRQFKKLRMFMHAEQGAALGLQDGDAVGFIRMGNDFTQNYYQIEIPLAVSTTGSTIDTEVWKPENEINLPIEVLAKIKALGISAGTLGDEDPTFYDVIDGVLQETSIPEFSSYTIGQQRVAIKGNPNFGDIRTLMVGIKNSHETTVDVCTEVWFNELRLSDMDNEGGWAAIASMDSNIADFMDISATGRRSTTGFGTIEQGPNQRSREDVKQYDVVTNVNLGQLLPKKWGVQIPFNYGQSEELVTPEYDQQYKDIKLQDRLDAATTNAEKETIKKQSEDYTKRQSINFIGVRKQRTGEAKPKFYDVENLTLNYSYNQVEHRDFEIENSLNQNVRVGANYNFSFDPIKIEPFKKNDSLFKGKYWKILKDFNFNLLPSSISVNTDFMRQFNKQKFRDLDLGGTNIGIEELYRRNYTFDFQYNINYNLTDALSLNFSASNNNIVRNYFVDDNLNGAQDPSKDVWDGFFDVGDPNRQFQQLGINYELPLNKIPALEFLRATYAYTGDFLWQKGSDLYGNLTINGSTYDLGNTISNASSHTLNANLDMNRLYRYLGLVRKNSSAKSNTQRGVPPGGQPRGNQQPTTTTKKNGLYNAAIDVLTTVKRIQFDYTQRNGTYLPGYMETPGFIGTLKPTFGFTFGSQRDIRYLAAKNGWLTVFPEFNQQYTEEESKILNFSAALEPMQDLKIDLTGGRTYNENLTESFNTIDSNNDGLSDGYNPLIRNAFGNFNISTSMIKTAFASSDENGSETFDNFRANRLEIARRLASKAGIDVNNPANLDAEGYPLGFGKTNQAVLLPAFLSAYTGKDAGKVSLGAFRDIPIPNWTLKYTGLMKLPWFKKHFKRFSVTHGYNSIYTINQFRSNLDYNAFDPNADYASQNPNVLDQSGNYKNETLFSAVALTEMFSPLVKVDFEMKNSMKILAEIKKDRRLFLSFDNNLLTEIKGSEYVFGLGYRIKDVKINSKMAGPRNVIKSDLNMKADISIRENKTIIRYLDLENNQVTAGQTIWGLKYTADYAFSKNLTGIFYFDYTFSEYAISTAFPQTSIRSGLTLRYNFGN
ncbi:T9SS outer membrane translocon Sov/SprA [Pontimicrobium aquaticum]|uniref:Cell surface protein SprA n=1 Tax=Pontimicrobium aquaticum TaxID=2565367 RepID=A0A4U0ELV3_9FLAO|nr:cell surface protein SprA [Pontimicrobium aquaticum]TJY32536.1 cell surface protein SprA [Pontimicrobium aquaticum]